MRVRAFAKINLSLRVLGTRADGFHELQTTLQSIALHDTLTVRRRRGPFRLTCDDARLPLDRRNLVVRAAHAVWKASRRRGAPCDVAIDLVKRIPLEAGLGGGSSDAAAALRALGTIWRVDESRLQAIAPKLGADVPYFFEGGTVLGLARGDVLVPLPDRAAAWVVLALPDFGVSTADAYGWWDSDRASRQSSFDKRAKSEELILRQAQDERRVEARRMSGTTKPRALSSSKGELRNDLQGPVAKQHPVIARIVSALRRAGAAHAAKSGSGSAVFGLFVRRASALGAARAVSAGVCRRTLVTRTLTRAAYRRLAGK